MILLCVAEMFVAILAVCAPAQFGTANVQWANANPTVGESPPLRNVKAPLGSRQTSLQSLSVEELRTILEDGFSDKCGACVSHGHLVSRIRSTCLSISGKEVKRQLTKRGVKCAGCSSREHYVDRLLDVVHMPILNS